MLNHDSENSILENLLNTLVAVFTLAMLFVSFGISIVMMPKYWRAYRNARSNLERAYFFMRFVSMWSMFYCLGMVLLLSADALFWESKVIHWWPSVSFILFGWDMSHANSVCLDVLVAFLSMIVTTFIANQLGEDELGKQYLRPDWSFRKDAIESVMARYEQCKRADPRNHPLWGTKGKEQRRQELMMYEKELKDIEDRVRTVHYNFGRKSPI